MFCQKGKARKTLLCVQVCFTLMSLRKSGDTDPTISLMLAWADYFCAGQIPPLKCRKWKGRVLTGHCKAKCLQLQVSTISYTYHHGATLPAEKVSSISYAEEGLNPWLFRNWKPFHVSRELGENAQSAMNVCIQERTQTVMDELQTELTRSRKPTLKPKKEIPSVLFWLAFALFPSSNHMLLSLFPIRHPRGSS